MRTFLKTVFVTFLLGGMMLVSVGMVYNVAQAGHEVSVTLCHATSSQTNPYVKVTVSGNSLANNDAWLNGHGGHGSDIWPNFTLADGTNIAAQGDQSILANNCKVPSTPTTQPTNTPLPTATNTLAPTATDTPEATATVQATSTTIDPCLGENPPETCPATNTPGAPTSTPTIPPTPTEEPKLAHVSVNEYCEVDKNSPPGVFLGISNAIVSIAGGTYDESGFVALVPGTYSFSWAALPGFEGSGSGTVIVPKDCNSLIEIIKALWRPHCVDNCGAARWETTSGPTGWQSNNTLGKGDPGILWATVNVNCDDTGGNCKYFTYRYGISQTTGFTVDTFEKQYHSFETTGADGKVYNMFVGYTVTCYDTSHEKGDECEKAKADIKLPNGWTAYNVQFDKYLVVPDKKGTPIYWEWPCSLSPSYAFTTAGGKAYNFPGTTSNDWIIWTMKVGLRPWPQTWPDSPVPGYWNWHKHPMDDTRAWATKLVDLKEWDTLTLPTK